MENEPAVDIGDYRMKMNTEESGWVKMQSMA